MRLSSFATAFRRYHARLTRATAQRRRLPRGEPDGQLTALPAPGPAASAMVGCLERAADLKDFLGGPPGRYVAGRTWVEFCTDDEIAGHLVWGRPSEADAREFMRVLPADGAPLARRRQRYFDVRRLETPHAAAFAVFALRMGEHASRLRELVCGVAVVHGGGLGGAMVRGFTTVVRAPFPISFF